LHAIEILARVAAQVGEADRAIGTLQKLLSDTGQWPLASSCASPALLRLVQCSIRPDDPRFKTHRPGAPKK